MVAGVLATATADAANVAVLMSADVDAYREAVRGFRATLRHRVVAEYDMEGDLDRGRKILGELQAKVKPDLIFAVGLWALQLVAGQPGDVPVVYAMVLNPPSVVGAGAKNITGASMNVPVEQTIRLFKALGPQIRRIGVIFDPAKTGYLVTKAADAAREQGLQLVARETRSPREAIPALEALQGQGIDALWILPDEANVAPTVVQQMLLISFRNRIPVLGLSLSQAEMGALLAVSFASGEDIGRQAGELANSVLAGSEPAQLPYTTARRIHVIVNLKTAQKLGLEIPRTILGMATTVIR
jgi:putative ABC transport system substrate-binding protein